MARIARNRAIDLRRLRTERISDLSDPIDDYDEASPTNPASEAEQNEELRRLEGCLDGLPAERKEMILLAYYSGWSREELAEKFSRPVNTGTTRVGSSLALLESARGGEYEMRTKTGLRRVMHSAAEAAERAEVDRRRARTEASPA